MDNLRKTSQQLILLSQCLHFQFSPELTEAIKSQLAVTTGGWQKVIALAFRQCVVPLLYRRLIATGLLADAPSEVCELLELTTRLNDQRNRRLRNQLLEFAHALDQIGTIPVVLKGGASLSEEQGGDAHGVVMSDLDLLVSQPDFEKVLHVANKLGYSVVVAAVDRPSHAISLQKSAQLVSIDLHHDVGPQRHLLPADEAIQRSEIIPSMPLRRLNPTARVIHNIYHAQIQNRNHELGIVSLQQLCNLGLIVQYHRDRIDWNVARSRFEAVGYSAPFQAYLHASQRLLGIETSPIAGSGYGAKLQLKRAMLQADWPWLHKLVTFWGVITPGMTEDCIRYRRASGFSSSLVEIFWRGFGRAWRRDGFRIFGRFAEARKRFDY